MSLADMAGLANRLFRSFFFIFTHTTFRYLMAGPLGKKKKTNEKTKEKKRKRKKRRKIEMAAS